MIGAIFGKCSGAAVPEGPITHMEYSTNNATRYPTCHFILSQDAETGVYTLTNGTGCDIEEAQTIEVPASFAEQLKQIVAEEKMLGYKDYYSSAHSKMICGGTGWKINIRFADSETEVVSSGYATFPKGEGLDRIKRLCIETWNQASKE